MNTKRKMLVMALTAILLFSMAGMASATSQWWYLTDTGNPYGFGHYLMYKDSGSGSFDLSRDPGQWRYWNANQPVTVDSIDMSGQWNVNIDYYVAEGDKTKNTQMTVQLGLWDGTQFVPKDSYVHTYTPTGEGQTSRNLNVYRTLSGFTLSSGDFLMLKITNGGGAVSCTVNFDVTDGPNSPCYIRSPSTDPGYPVPELSSLLLTSLGVLMLGGFVVYSRRRNNK